MKKINKYLKVFFLSIILIFTLVVVSFYIYMSFFYEDKRWSRMPDLIESPWVINWIYDEKNK